MDEKLKSTLRKIKLLSEQNPEFAQELRKMFERPSSASVVSNTPSLSGDIIAIREALEIRANKSVMYDFVDHEGLKSQLIIDNLRMENAALNLQKDEKERFYTFCINAFYQLENITNYYFHVTFPEINKLLDVVELYTLQEGDYRFKRTGKEVNVSSIHIVDKLNALCNIFFPGDNIKITISTLRKVRNEGEHRCMAIQNNKDKDERLYNFFLYQNFNSIRILLKQVVNAVRENNRNPIIKNAIKATIKTLLPGACFVSVGTQTFTLPSTLLPKVRNCKVNDEIKIVINASGVMEIVI